MRKYAENTDDFNATNREFLATERVSLLYKNPTKITLLVDLKRSRKAIQAAFLTNGKKSLRAAIC